MFTGQSIQLVALEDGLVELRFDRLGESINKFDSRTVEELRGATNQLRAWPDVRGVLVSSGKRGFIVGADIFEFGALFERTEAQIAAHIGAHNEVFRDFEDLDVPVVTELNGVALGGGLEMALASDYRVAARNAQVGLPEVKLGLFPGYGGTVRLPRLTGAALAFDWITTGTPRSASEALAGGVVDDVVELHQLREAALTRLKSAVATGQWRARRAQRRGPFAQDPAALEGARARLERDAIRLPAALAAVELMASCAHLERDAALRRESLAFGRIARTQAAASLVQLFVDEQLVKTEIKLRTERGRATTRLGVVGAGIMGGGIAYSAASHGLRVVMTDIAAQALEQGMGEARKQLEKLRRTRQLSDAQAAEVLGAIQPQLDYDGFEQLDLVIEAVVEDMTIKQRVLASLEQRVGHATLIASNTSSLSIHVMAERLARPENFLGMHFFNPVPVMPLVEIVRGPRTAAQAIDTAVACAAALGKTPIVVRDCPGFLVNRIFIAYLLGFFFALRDGADFRKVDSVMEQFGWPMGPAYLQDVIGMDTMLRVVEVITAGYPQRFGHDGVLAPAVLVKANRLGQKNGVGYYRYEADPKGRPVKRADEQVPVLLGGVRRRDLSPLSELELLERLMLPMIIEAALCLEEGVAESPEEIDLALVLGLGFPRHAGGPLKYADWLGLRHVVERCDTYRELGPLYQPTARMRAMAGRGVRYFTGERRS
ncbi:MAG: fatty acid oxidation complex subunit alpha FadB [Steroidobacteraceae bacterium]